MAALGHTRTLNTVDPMNTYIPDLADIVEEAYERATGGTRAVQTGYDYRTARRSLNLLLMEWANKGINMWTLDQGVVPLQKGVTTYQLPADTVDLVEHSIRTGATNSPHDVRLNRIAMPQYTAITNKAQRGQPQSIFIQRVSPYPLVTLWPVPDNDSYQLVAWRLRRIAPATAPGSNTVDIPFRFIPAMIAGLAYHMATKLPEGSARAIPLKAAYDEAFAEAAAEDRDRATVRFVPRIRR